MHGRSSGTRGHCTGDFSTSIWANFWSMSALNASSASVFARLKWRMAEAAEDSEKSATRRKTASSKWATSIDSTAFSDASAPHSNKAVKLETPKIAGGAHPNGNFGCLEEVIERERENSLGPRGAHRPVRTRSVSNASERRMASEWNEESGHHERPITESEVQEQMNRKRLALFFAQCKYSLRHFHSLLQDRSICLSTSNLLPVNRSLRR